VYNGKLDRRIRKHMKRPATTKLAHHDLICVHRRTRSLGRWAGIDVRPARLHDGRLPSRTAKIMMMMMMMMGTRLNIHQNNSKKRVA
jgi:hypothetical protein